MLFDFPERRTGHRGAHIGDHTFILVRVEVRPPHLHGFLPEPSKSAQIQVGEFCQERSVDRRVKCRDRVMQVVTAIDKASLEIDVNEFCGNAVSESYVFDCRSRNHRRAPFSVLFIDVRRGGQVVGRTEQSMHSGIFENPLSSFDREPAVSIHAGSAGGSPGAKSMFMLFDGVWHLRDLCTTVESEFCG